MNNDLLYQVALTLVPHIGPVQARILVNHFGHAAGIFTAKTSLLEKLEGIGEVRARSISKFAGFKKAEAELAFIEQYRITPLFLTDPAYPRRLLNCYDPPTLLYYRGSASLNMPRIISIVGTRSKTEYGKQLTEKLVADLQQQQVMVISGLALGVDAAAHKAAVKYGLPTVAVVAHGLDNIYPPEHAGLAKEILRQNGGLVTEFRSNTKPDRHCFPSRNRIVAGMSDALVVVETAIQGGSMITAELANSYHRDVFAFPGRITDSRSTGCNQLIKTNKAALLTGAPDLIAAMGWEEQPLRKRNPQKTLFTQLSDAEKIIVGLLQEHSMLGIDELNLKSRLSGSTVAASILNLELQNIVAALPGKQYKLL